MLHPFGCNRTEKVYKAMATLMASLNKERSKKTCTQLLKQAASS